MIEGIPRLTILNHRVAFAVQKVIREQFPSDPVMAFPFEGLRRG